MAPYQHQDFYSLDNTLLYHSLGVRSLKYQKNSSSVHIDSQREMLTERNTEIIEHHTC